MDSKNSLQKILFESKYIALCLLDRSGKVIETNQTFKHQLGGPPLEFSDSLSIRNFTFWNQNLKYLDKAWEEQLEKSFASFKVQLSNGNSEDHYEISLTKANDKGDVLMELFKVKEQSKSEKELANMKNELDNIASTISHDLRAPVSNISYLLSIFDEDNEVQLEELVSSLKKSNEKTLGIIDRMGASVNSKLKNSSTPEPSLQPMICGVLERLEDEISQTQARVIVDINDPSDWKLPKGAFEMILKQLLSNSLKYRKEDETPKIVITCSRKNGDRIIEVKDNGLGFDMAGNEQRVFGLFQTFHNRPDSRGIGLFQVKNRLLSIGGAISLTSQKGVGTTVTLNFKQNELEEAPLCN